MHTLLLLSAVTFLGQNAAALKDTVGSGAIVDLSKSAVGTLLEARLLRDVKLAWVDQSDIEKVLKEQELQAAFGPEGGGRRAVLGKLLKADVVILLRSAPSRDDKQKLPMHLVVFETQRGLRLWSQEFAQSKDAAADAVVLGDIIQGVLRARSEKISDICAVPPFINNDLGYQFDYLKAAYGKVLEQHLLSRKGVLLVEIAEAQAIAKELALTDPGARLERQLPLYFMGEYRVEGKGDQRRITLELKLMRGLKEIAKRSQAGLSLEAAPQALCRLADALSANVLAAGQPQVSPDAEAQQLAQRAEALQKLGNFADALSVLEASLLVKPKQFKLHGRAAVVASLLAKEHFSKAYKDPAQGYLALGAFRRAVENQESYVLSVKKAGIPRQPPADPVEPAGSVETLFAGISMAQYRPLTPELGELKEQVLKEYRESLLRLTRWRARGLFGDENTYLATALRAMPSRSERISTVASVILELQDLRWAKERSAVFVLREREFHVSELPALMKQLTPAANAEVKAAMVSMKRVLEMKTPERPKEVRVATGEVAFRPLNLVWENPNGKTTPIAVIGCISANKIDVFVAAQGLFLMKEKGRLQNIWTSAGGAFARAENGCFDGRYVWMPIERQRGLPSLLVIDTLTGTVWPITPEDGLPAATQEELKVGFVRQYMVAAPLAPGKVCVAGTFGRSWLAIVTFDPTGGKSVKVFHEAREVYDLKDKEQWKRTTVAFEPAGMYTLSDRPNTAGKVPQRVILGRDCRNNEVTKWPLLIDPENLSVEVASEMIYLSTLKNGIAKDGGFYAPGKGIIFYGYPGTKKIIPVTKMVQGAFTMQGDRIGIRTIDGSWHTGSLARQELHFAADMPNPSPGIGVNSTLFSTGQYGQLFSIFSVPERKMLTYQLVFSSNP